MINNRFKGYVKALKIVYSELNRIEKIYTNKRSDSYTIIKNLKALCRNMLRLPIHYTNGEIDTKSAESDLSLSGISEESR